MTTFRPDPAPEKGIEPLREILSRLAMARGWARLSDRERLEKAWRDIVGENWAARSQPGPIKRGVLEIYIADSMIHQELLFIKDRVLQVLRDSLQLEIKDLKFKSGR